MNKEGYDFLVEAGQFYTFISSGKKGDIAKMVIFQRVAPETYNLVLADYDFEDNRFSDTITSNNGDLPKIMATVVQIVLDFLEKNRNAGVVLEANSVSRSRLYNRLVKNYHQELASQVLILVENEDSFAEYEVGQEHNKFYLYTRQ